MRRKRVVHVCYNPEDPGEKWKRTQKGALARLKECEAGMERCPRRDDAQAELGLLRQLLCAKEGESSEQLGHRIAFQLHRQRTALESIANNRTYEMSGDVYEKMRDMVKEALK